MELMMLRLVARRYAVLLVCLFIVTVGLCLRLLRGPHINSSKEDPDPGQAELIDVVLTFPLLTDPNWNNSGYRHLTNSKKEARMEEYMESLKNTLAHPRIGFVHCLYDQKELPGYVKTRISNSKLQFHYIKNTHLALTVFGFVFEALQGRLVMVMQADTYPAEGFQLVDGATMRKKRLFYALTRHGKMEASCDMFGDFCDTQEYVGSHDAYIFVPTGALSTSQRDILHKNAMSWGIDLVIAWLFSDMGYSVLNPCKRIFIYHLHCSMIRDTGRVRVNTPNITGWFPPTSRLM